MLLADALERVGDITGAEQQLVKAVANGGDENVLVPRIALMMLDRGDHEKLVREFKDRKLASRETDSTLRATVVQLDLSSETSTSNETSALGDASGNRATREIRRTSPRSTSSQVSCPVPRRAAHWV